MQLSVVDKIIIGIFSIILIVSIYFLSNSESVSTSIKEAISIGTLGSPINDVKKRRDGNINWFHVSEGDSVVENDFVFTGNQSNVTLNFNNGNSVSIEENSLVHLVNYENYPTLSVSNGTFQAKAKEKIEINIRNNDKKVSAENAYFQLSRNKENYEINVFEGEITLNSNGSSQKLKRGQTLQIDEEGHKVIRRSIRLKEAELKDGKINLKWISQRKNAPFIITLARGSKFKEVKTIEASTNEVIFDYDEYYSYFKIESKKNSEISSSVFPIISTTKFNSNYKISNLATRDAQISNSRKIARKSNKNGDLLDVLKRTFIEPIQNLIRNTKKSNEFKDSIKKTK